jgi:hypothetical protein
MGYPPPESGLFDAGSIRLNPLPSPNLAVLSKGREVITHKNEKETILSFRRLRCLEHHFWPAYCWLVRNLSSVHLY